MKKITALLTLSILVGSCSIKNPVGQVKSLFTAEKYDAEAFSQLVTEQLATIKDSSSNSSTFETLYKNDSKAVWLSETGDTKLAEALIAALKDLQYEGLVSQRYQVNQLEQALQHLIQKSNWPVAEVFTVDTMLSRAYNLAAHHLMFGAIDQHSVDSNWHIIDDSTLIMTRTIDSANVFGPFRSQLPAYEQLLATVKYYQQLQQDSTYNSLKKNTSSDDIKNALALMSVETRGYLIPEDSLSQQQRAIKSYQKYFGLKMTGVIDSATRALLKGNHMGPLNTYYANMERLRWMPQHLPSTYIMVVVPKMELAVMDGGALKTTRRVVVGKPFRATPSLSQSMTNIVFNPPWGVPPTIKKNDIIPGIARSGGYYLRRKGLKAYDYKGRVVNNPRIIHAGNMNNYTFKQDPGPSNALGNVKFNLPNRWDIYLHDTPHRWDFKKSNRALSSGCIRVQDPLDLAHLILNDLDGQPDYTSEKIDSIVQKRATKQVLLNKKVPVFIAYLTAYYADFGHDPIVVFRDIYQRDTAIINALAQF